MSPNSPSHDVVRTDGQTILLPDIQETNTPISWEPAVVSGVVCAGIFVLLGCSLVASLGVGFTCMMLVRTMQELGATIPLDLILPLIAGLQWIVGPTLCYLGLSEHYKYYMYVDESSYMMLAVPGVVAFSLGLLVFRTRKDTGPSVMVLIGEVRVLIDRQPLLPIYLISVGFVAVVARGYFPPSLGFVFGQLENLKYIGLFFLLFSGSRYKWNILAIGIALTAISSLRNGLFHDLFLWCGFLALYLPFIRPTPMWQKVGALVAGVVCIFLIQGVKSDFRELVGKQRYEGNRSVLYLRLIEEAVFGKDDRGEEVESEFSEGAVEAIVIRLNQGWIISRIMEYVPAEEVHAKGETVKDALVATLLPRFLAPNKARAGGQKNYERFTGYKLIGTAMGISLLGEGYANFGTYGAWLFMLTYGFVIGLILSWTMVLARTYPSLILWLPLLFLHTIKAETELVVVLNYLIKTIVIVAAFLIGSKLVFKHEF